MENQEKKLEEIVVDEQPKEEVAKKVKASARSMEWVIDNATTTKKCSACEAIMRGWAHREVFNYCPKCGAKATNPQ